jgi:hypothetical protein
LFVLFFVIVIVSLELLPWTALDHDPPPYTYDAAGVTDGTMFPAYLLRWCLVMFCPGWPQIMILLIFISQVGGITGMDHYVQTKFFLKKNQENKSEIRNHRQANKIQVK